MPLCGYTKEMLDNIGGFNIGLKDAVENKSKSQGITIEAALGIEINEMHAFIGELDNLANHLDRQALLGTTYLAQALYRGAAEYSEKNNVPLQRALDIQKEHLRELFFKTDQYYEKECKGTANPMKKLVDRLNEGLLAMETLEND
jgi:hypothetical protein